MLLVKTRNGKSTIEGIGCFADQFIPKGTVIWRYLDGFDQKIAPEEMARLSDVARATFLK